MKLITAIIRPEKLQDVKEALFRIGVTGLSIWRVTGHGGEQETVQHYRGTTVVHDFHEKIRLEMACSEPFVERTIQAIIEGARTGAVGDGKIFVQPIEQVVRIRTGDRDDAALTAINADAVQRQSLAIRALTSEEG
jgi:nitrogen regulatory protein P-II 1